MSTHSCFSAHAKPRTRTTTSEGFQRSVTIKHKIANLVLRSPKISPAAAASPPQALAAAAGTGPTTSTTCLRQRLAKALMPGFDGTLPKVAVPSQFDAPRVNPPLA
ncbi:MAG: hypothetical protein L0387_17350 [Acidobacteria bacterium]|nr:hypothetical protein [Acidobacteriota bacterium]MCI0724208.1 hypothetical protein [Acidobacteriota bacterium]